MQTFNYLRPAHLDELCQALQQPHAKIVAGGTDVLPQMHTGRLQPALLVDISRVSELEGIRIHNTQVEIGALTTFAAIQAHPTLRAAAPALTQAAQWVGAPMTRQRATLGGNLANASPAADAVPPLMIYNAEVTLTSAKGSRSLPLAQFLLGPGQTALQRGEFIQSVRFELPAEDLGSAFLKIGPRRGMTIAIVSAAAAVRLSPEGRLEQVRVAVGASAPTVIRCPQTENLLHGQLPSAELWQSAAQQIAVEISPIDDVRASRAYRRRAAGVLAVRALQAALSQAQEAAQARTV
ncbi:FAD binding domain-containing protein [Levilinea saccharolytica]|uniref:Aerobic-type carbon monoxide dehydrogenase, middle subunit CoxM/CutM homologs n=1 Tax=Levilinea saccharolytica TaxID=229921 RepID=A0A0M8JQ14_9CHLR|nr:xanthine dehydrogenase family protein subunit M [Levilinea saccharolytica]KPL76208.1 hypothetical protein ADN01_16780 [Levilinea saccharolytica]GAP19028.1 aerobic-type carbon monoxide dehydrogenase, middle subunit CoxM/CutM homologs [Levilinea saccharolytica]